MSTTNSLSQGVQWQPISFDAVRRFSVASNQIAHWWLGQASFLIKLHTQQIILVDPFLSGGVKGSGAAVTRLTAAPIAAAELRPDIILITHDHLDHLDADTLTQMPADLACPVVGPRRVIARLERETLLPNCPRVLLDAGDVQDVAGVTIRATFCIPNEERVVDTIGLYLSAENGPTWYMVGDSGYHDFLAYMAKYPIDVLLVPINGGLGNMPQVDGCRLVRLLRPKVVVPYHYGMFEGNTADPADFQKLLYVSHSEPPTKVLTVGEAWVYG